MTENDVCQECGHDHEMLDCPVCEANGEPATACSPAKPGTLRATREHMHRWAEGQDTHQGDDEFDPCDSEERHWHD